MPLVRLSYRQDRSQWQLVYADPQSGKRTTRLVGNDEAKAREEATALESQLANIPTVAAKKKRYNYRHRAPLTDDEYMALLAAIRRVVGVEHSTGWIALVMALRNGEVVAEAMKRVTHKVLTITPQNVNRVLAEAGKKVGIDRVDSNCVRRA